MIPQITCLSNGIRVVSETRPNLETASIGIWVDVGSRHESKRLNGISHFLEHMLFKGTKGRSAKDIVLDIEAVGGQINAYTTRDSTTFYARVLKADTELALDVLSDIVLNSVCDPVEVEREKDVILQEIGQAVDTPDDVVFDHLQAAAYGDNPIARPILGEPHLIKAFTQKDLLDYLRQHYAGSNLVVSAVGNLAHDDLVRMVENKLGHLKKGEPRTVEKASYIGGRREEKRELEQAHVTLGWPAASFHDDEYYALQVYSTILGGGMSSRLFQQVREERGLAYSVYSFSSSHADTGMLGIYAGTGPDLLPELLKVIKSEMVSLTDGPSDIEFTVATSQLKASLMMALEATTSRMEQMGRQLLLFDRIIPVSEMLENVEAVSLKDVCALAEGFVNCAEGTIALVGAGDFEQIQI